MRANEIITEAANLKKQAAIAIAMKKAGKKPKQGVAEGFTDDNFTIDDIHRLEQIKDFETLKARAKYLIKGKPARRMKPEKIAYFYDRVDTLTSPMKVIKMMYDLLLAGEGMKTIGSRNSTDPNVYQKRFTEEEQGVAEGENWSKHNNKRVGGMSKKSVNSYRRSHPGSKIQTAVTTKPSKLKKGSKAAKRRASFCARMKGMKKHRTGAKTARDPNSNINKSLRRWNCESIEQLQELVMIAEQYIRNNKK